MSGVGRNGDDFIQFAIGIDIPVRVMKGVHIVGEEQHFAIRRAHIELHIVLGAVASVTVARSGKHIDSGAAQPLIHIHVGGDSVGEGGSGRGHPCGPRHHTAVVVAVFIVLDEKGPPVVLFVGAHVPDRGSQNGIGCGHFVPLRSAVVGGIQLIDEFVFKDHAVPAVGILIIKEDIG